MAPTAVDTSVLDQFRRQFYQWYLIDNRSRSEVAKSFHHLFQRITETTKLKIIVGLVIAHEDGWGLFSDQPSLVAMCNGEAAYKGGKLHGTQENPKKAHSSLCQTI